MAAGERPGAGAVCPATEAEEDSAAPDDDNADADRFRLGLYVTSMWWLADLACRLAAQRCDHLRCRRRRPGVVTRTALPSRAGVRRRGAGDLARPPKGHHSC